jgi:hypothetical protein
VNQVKIYNIFWNSKKKKSIKKKEEEDELVQGKKKNLNPRIFKSHIFLISCLF